MEEIHKILIVEDVPFNLFLLETILNSIHVDFVSAENGKEAVDVLKNNTDIELILMDIETPTMTGIEAVAIIRDTFDYPYCTIPALAVTAHFDSDYLSSLLRQGFDGYLVKPVTKEKIINCLMSNRALVYEYSRRISAISSKQHDSLYNVERLKEWSGDDEAVLTRLLGLFVSETPKVLAVLEGAINDRDWQVVKDEAHKLGPQMSFLGVDELVRKINNLETNALQSENALLVEELFFDIKIQILSLLEAIKADLHFS